MVTAGIFLVARMSPLFELSEAALSFVLVTGATTAFFMALIGLVQNDIKRVVAYSTLSQLGYMTVALGVSAYEVAIFHLGTHAFFKALLFLGAGSVIIAMHHEQDMRKMGGLRALMPITYATMVIGSLALAGIPPFAGFFSKDAIIESVHFSDLWGAGYAYIAVLLGVFLTAFYSFRLLFMTFHGNNRADEHTRLHLDESPKVVTWPLVLLAIPSICAGFLFFGPVINGSYFGEAIFIKPEHDVVATLANVYQGKEGFGLFLAAVGHGIFAWPFWLAIAGIVFAWYCYCKNLALPGKIAAAFGPLTRIVENKYGFDQLYQKLFAGGSLVLGKFFHRYTDAGLIDGVGRTFDYAFAMIFGVVVLISVFVWGV